MAPSDLVISDKFPLADDHDRRGARPCRSPLRRRADARGRTRATPSRDFVAAGLCDARCLARSIHRGRGAAPTSGRDLGYSAHTLQSVISAHTVASAGFLLLGGRAADLLGRRRVFVAGLELYAGDSLAGGLAPGPVFPLVARAAQGLGGALVFPPPSRWSISPSPKAERANGRWPSGAEPRPPGSCSAYCWAVS